MKIRMRVLLSGPEGHAHPGEEIVIDRQRGEHLVGTEQAELIDESDQVDDGTIEAGDWGDDIAETAARLDSALQSGPLALPSPGHEADPTPVPEEDRGWGDDVPDGLPNPPAARQGRKKLRP